MKPTERITLLRQRHVHAATRGAKGLIHLRRIQHVEVARGEAELRRQGYHLHVVQDPMRTNFCPYKHESVAVISCLIRSANPTEPVCYGCPTAMEFAKFRGHLQEHDVRKSPADWQPRTQGKYINGTLMQVPYDPWVYLRVELPNGDVLFFKRYADGLVEPDYAARPDNNRDTHWWGLRAEDQAPLPSHLPPEVAAQLASKADAKRSSMTRGGDKPTTKKPKKGK